jgi:hypothetical protein
MLNPVSISTYSHEFIQDTILKCLVDMTWRWIHVYLLGGKYFIFITLWILWYYLSSFQHPSTLHVRFSFSCFATLLSSVLTKFVYQWEWTDRGADILDNCLANVRINSGMLNFVEAKVCVRELDWKLSWPPPVSTCDPSDSRFSLHQLIPLILLFMMHQ